MKFSYNWLQSFFVKRLPQPQKLAEILTLRVFEVEGIEKKYGDYILNIDILPNRGDCLSHWGLAREIAAILKLNLKFEFFHPKEEKNLKTGNFINLKVENKNTCPRYSSRIVFDVKVKSSPDFIKKRLKACGLKPINNIVDITNYVMLEIGQPLHAFDFAKISSKNGKKEILVRLAKKNEKILTLDGKEYNLNEKILVIADNEKPLAIAGIKGGKEAEISKNTKTVFLESANFDPVLIQIGSRSLNLITDASQRFSWGLDPSFTTLALDRACWLISKFAQGKIAQGIVDYYPKKEIPKNIYLNLDYVNSLLGIKIEKKLIAEILERLNFKILKSLFNKIFVEIPTFRRDIQTQEDLIEEIGRILGYEKIPSHFPTLALHGPPPNQEILWEKKIKESLKTAGLDEVMNYSFCKEEDINYFGYSKNEVLKIKNPVSLEFQFLRPTLICNLLKNVVKNQPYFKDIKIFELGKIFRKENGKILEKKMVSGLLLGEKFLEAKGILDFLFENLGISDVKYHSFKLTPENIKAKIWKKFKVAEINVLQTKVGFLGEISKDVLENYGLEGEVTVFDLDFEKISKVATEEIEYEPISIFPYAVRDISILVPYDVLVDDVLRKIQFISPLIRDVDLFDIYEGEEIGEGKKSLAFHIIFQAKDRTLSPDELDSLQNKIISELEKEPNWKVRR